MVWSLEFVVRGFGFGVWGVEFWVLNWGFWAGLQVKDLFFLGAWFGIWSSGFRVSQFGLRVLGEGFRGKGFGCCRRFRVRVYDLVRV